MSTKHKSRKSKSKVTRCYLAELTLKEGFELIAEKNLRNPLYLFKTRIMRDKARFAVLRTNELKCHFCGIEATHFLIERSRHDHVMPFQINVYAKNSMMTWDHILPKSMGGSNSPVNGRIACKKCNEERGNEMTLDELLWTLTQDPKEIFKVQSHKVKTDLKMLIHGAREITNGNINPPGLRLPEL